MTTTTNIENQIENKDEYEINTENTNNEIKTIKKEKDDPLSKSDLQNITVDKKLKDSNSNSSSTILSTNSRIVKKKLASAGCLTCRQRHKKCTRERPVCETCLKTGYTCFWREPGTKFTDYKVKLIHSDKPIGTVLKPNLLIDSTNNILSTDYHLSDCDDCIEVATNLDDSVKTDNKILNDNNNNNNNNTEDSLISLARKAVSITNAYMNSPEMQNLLRNESIVSDKNLSDIIDEKIQKDKEINNNNNVNNNDDIINIKKEIENKENDSDNESEDEGTEYINGPSENSKVKKEDDSDSDGGNNNNNGNSDSNESSNDNSNNNENSNNNTDNETKYDSNEQNQRKDSRSETNNNNNNSSNSFQDRLYDILETIETTDNISSDLIINEGTMINFRKETCKHHIDSWYKRHLSNKDGNVDLNIDQNNSNYATSLTTTLSPITHLSQTKEIVPLGFQFESYSSCSSSDILVDHISVINYLSDNPAMKENDTNHIQKVPKTNDQNIEKVIHRRQSDRVYNKFVDKKRGGKISKEEAAKLLFDTISSSKLRNIKAVKKKLLTDGRRKIPKVIQ